MSAIKPTYQNKIITTADLDVNGYTQEFEVSGVADIAFLLPSNTIQIYPEYKNDIIVGATDTYEEFWKATSQSFTIDTVTVDGVTEYQILRRFTSMKRIRFRIVGLAPLEEIKFEITKDF